ncbi:MAG: DUF4062 domain-containing protein [Candidatus Eremiobacteraeota bacterium]|nr:DUF4062 domain-containing protein [Candidatus Eremiobacteraeota bacterium]
MALRVPTVMVSSTFYDLREVRHQLARMIEDEMGYDSLISESPAFPIDFDKNTIDNCRRRVEENADIFVLIIGRRYGTVDPRYNKSVTNLEYTAARAKNIPIYVFIERGVQTLFDAWSQAAPENKAALGATVEDARLFEFIKQVRSVDLVWTNGFDYACDITSALRVQLAYLMKRGIATLQATQAHPDRAILDTLSPEAYRLAVDRPRLWEYYLFAQLVDDEVRSVSDKRREYQNNLIYGNIITLQDEALFPWIRSRLAEFRTLINNVSAIVPETSAAFGAPGEPGSAHSIAFVARQLGKIYSALIDWSQEVRCARTSSADLQVVVDELSAIGMEIIEAIGCFGADMRTKLDAAIYDLDENPVPPGGEPRHVNIALRLDVPRVARVTEALDQAFRRRGINRG